MNTKDLLSREDIPNLKTTLFLICADILYISFLNLFHLFIKKVSPFNTGFLKDTFILGILHTCILNFFLVTYLLIRFKKYFLTNLKLPSKFFIKGFQFYLLLIPFIMLTGFLSNNFMRSIGIVPRLQEVVALFLKSDSYLHLSLIFITSCFIAPIAEEIIFRGVIYKSLKEKFSIPISIFISAAIFAFLHLELSSLPVLFFLGVVLATLFEKYGNLWVPIGLHFFNNLFANLALLIIKFTNIIDINKLNF